MSRLTTPTLRRTPAATAAPHATPAGPRAHAAERPAAEAVAALVADVFARVIARNQPAGPVAATGPGAAPQAPGARPGLASPAAAVDAHRSSPPPVPGPGAAEPTPAAGSHAPMSYRALADAVIAAEEALDYLERNSLLGRTVALVSPLAVDAAEVPAFEIWCERLDRGRDLHLAANAMAQWLRLPETRAAVLERNPPVAFDALCDLASCNLVRAACDRRIVISALVNAHRNAASAPFVQRMLASGRLTPDDPRVRSFEEVRSHPLTAAAVAAGAPITAQVEIIAERTGDDISSVTHAAWGQWEERAQVLPSPPL